MGTQIFDGDRLAIGFRQFKFDYSGDPKKPMCASPRVYVDGWTPPKAGYATVEAQDGTIYCVGADRQVCQIIPTRGQAARVPAVADVLQTMQEHACSQDKAVAFLGGNP